MHESRRTFSAAFHPSINEAVMVAPHFRRHAGLKVVITFVGLAALASAAAGAQGAPDRPNQCVTPAAQVDRVAETSPADMPITEPLVTFDSAWSIIARTHWDTTYNGVNWRAVRDTLRPRAAEAQTLGQLRSVLSAMVARLHQSHFSIIPGEISDGVVLVSGRPSEDRSGTVGASFRVVDGLVVVASVRDHGGAQRAGVRTGWILDRVGGCPIDEKLARIPQSLEPRRAALAAYSIVSELLAGPVGDTVMLSFRDGQNRTRIVPVERGTEPGTIAKFGNLPPLNAHLELEKVKQGTKTVGVIRFNIWMPVLAAQFDAAIDSLRNTDGIVLDLRGNFGGVGGMSMGIAGHFLDSAYTIGVMHQRGLELKFVANPRRVDTRAQRVTPFAGPLAIVVDELSISTTEIFAGGLQSMGRARVFGTQTSGQALPAVTERLPNGDILYHAIADFLSPTGKPLEGDGVIPDVLAPLTRQALLAGRDPALDAAVQWAAATASASKLKVTP